MVKYNSGIGENVMRTTILSIATMFAVLVWLVAPALAATMDQSRPAVNDSGVPDDQQGANEVQVIPPGKDHGLPASGQMTIADVQGQPTALNPGNSFGYFIFQEGDIWIVKTTTRGEIHKFTGTILTGSTFINSAPFNPNSKDSVRINSLGTRINFTFKTGGARKGFLIHGKGDDMPREWPDSVSGLTFVVADGSTVKFILKVDGLPVKSSDIYIGRNNRHPSGSEF